MGGRIRLRFFGECGYRYVIGCALAYLVLMPMGCAPTSQIISHENTSGISLDKSALDAIRAATFEVVVLKPTKDSLSYEKPLPVDLIPYVTRKDQYYSVGTAFAIEADRFVSAAHVLGLGNKSQYKEMFLRDQNGNVYSIDKIMKYSDRRDFVVFSLRNKKAQQVLTPNIQPKLNEKIYAVGNALGQGIVIRDGLYTSDTPEERNGEWSWVRFSAAASPGNSGGPLLDKDGKLIGVVLRKSENENLNFALPIAEILNAKDQFAILDTQLLYKIDNMDMTKLGFFKKEILLPKSYDELNHELISHITRFGTKLMQEMFAENQAEIFPNGSGANVLLHNNFSSVFPRMIAKSADGMWDAYGPNKINDAELEANGFLAHGNLGSTLYLRLRKPDNISLEKLYGDSQLFMNLALKGLNFSRTIGPQKIKITSLGKAQEEYVHTDSYRRKWMVKTWLVEYSDEKIMLFALPVPGGYIAMMRATQTGEADGHALDLKKLTDFIYVSYYATLEQWREFLAMKEILPPALSDFTIGINYGDNFKYQSKRISFSYDTDLMKITKNSDLQLNFSYFKENNKVIWDVSKVIVGEDKNTSVAFVVTRNIKPPEKMNDKYQSDWENIVNRKHPYDSASFFNDKKTIIGAVYAKKAHRSEPAHVPTLYTVVYGTEGNSQQKIVENRLNKFMQAMTVYEY